MSEIIFLQAVPKDFYFVWQLDVQITNFRKHNISDRMEIIVWYPKGYTDFKEWRRLEGKYPEVKFFYYEDDGVDLGLYIPQLRPHSLKKHFLLHKERLEGKTFFYHDSDIIFNYLPDFTFLEEGEINWQSNTSSYLDYSYLRRKEKEGKIPEDEAISLLASIGGVTVDDFKKYDAKSGGAQYILKNIDYTFWEDVEKSCINIRKAFFFGSLGSVNKKYFQNENQGFQSWCADMWGVNMALWKRGKVTDVTDLLDFSWATDSAETYHKKPIFHLAGATKGNSGIFYKGSWINKSPIGEKHNVKKDSACYFYVEAINDVK